MKQHVQLKVDFVKRHEAHYAPHAFARSLQNAMRREFPGAQPVSLSNDNRHLVSKRRCVTSLLFVRSHPQVSDCPDNAVTAEGNLRHAQPWIVVLRRHSHRPVQRVTAWSR
jgi:hypothetical protein